MDQQLEDWLKSSGAQAPILLVGALPDIGKLSGKGPAGAEVVSLSSTEKQITVAQVRGLIAALSRKTYAPRRLVVVPAAERLNAAAANALLKTLEESAAPTRFLLQTYYPRRLPVTILSRCQRLFTGQAEAEGDEWSARLESQLRTLGPSPELLGAFQRWRDFHQIKQQNGNVKLAMEVLLAYLPPEQA